MEETELIRVTFQGTEMFLKLGGAAIKDALKFIKFLITAAPQYNRWKINRDTEKMKNELTRAEYELVRSRQKIQAGGMKYEDFIKAFGAEERTIINITDTSADRFHELAKRHKLTYTLMPDLNIADGVFQIMVPAAQADIYKVIIDRITSEEFAANQKIISGVENEIGELRKEIIKCENTLEQLEQEGKKDSNEYRITEEKISGLENEIMDKEKDISLLKENETGEITYEDYMATNQFAFDHQELFEAMMEEGIELHSDGLKESLLNIAKQPDKTEVPEKSGKESVQNIQEKDSFDKFNITKTDADKALDSVLMNKDIIGRDPGIVLCDPDNPYNYIKAFKGISDKEGKQTCTMFNVYVGGDLQKSDSDYYPDFSILSDINETNLENVKHFNDMKNEIKEKAGFQGKEILVFDSEQDYKIFIRNRENAERGESVNTAGKKESIYLVNPNTAGIAIKIDRKEEGTCRCTVMKEGKDTNIAYEINKNASASDVLPFTKMIDKELRKISDVHENEWVCVDSRTKYDMLISQMEKNLPSSSQTAEKEIEEKIPEAKEKLKKEGKIQAENTKQLIEIPRDNVLVLPQIDGVNFNYTVFSDNMKYVAELPYYSVKQGNADDRLMLVLENDESIDFKERRADGKAGSISDQKSLNNFLNENIQGSSSFGKQLSEVRNPVRQAGERK